MLKIFVEIRRILPPNYFISKMEGIAKLRHYIRTCAKDKINLAIKESHNPPDQIKLPELTMLISRTLCLNDDLATMSFCPKIAEIISRDRETSEHNNVGFNLSQILQLLKCNIF